MALAAYSVKASIKYVFTAMKAAIIPKKSIDCQFGVVHRIV
jgi:hypothetical protein